MLVKLNPDEVRQAIREWFIRRGVDCEKNEINFAVVSAGQTYSGSLIADVKDLVLPSPKDPYR